MLSHALNRKNHTLAQGSWRLLQHLCIIEHPEVEKILAATVRSKLDDFMHEHMALARESAARYDFDEAQQNLRDLHDPQHHFPDELAAFNLDRMQQYLNFCIIQHADKIRDKNQTADALRLSRQAVENLMLS